ncbi:hypothetical protein SKA34_00842 [Photobacterium sp. SKA34]|nr:pantocin A family RiPP [Photobacterium sp. SKA34]EAR53337.1 hypothetical protein SKA34_00842 [Photobacterium sp. SKA34]
MIKMKVLTHRISAISEEKVMYSQGEKIVLK